MPDVTELMSITVGKVSDEDVLAIQNALKEQNLGHLVINWPGAKISQIAPTARLPDLSKLVQDSVPDPVIGRKRILLACPTLRRREQALANLRRALEMSSGRHEIVPVLVVNLDDEQWPTGGDYTGAHPAPPQARVLRIPAGSSKVQAHNAAPADFEGRCEAWDVVVLLADDQVCEARGWDDVIARELYRQWDDGDGALHYNDGTWHNRLCTQCIMGRRYYLRFGYVYSPAYVSFCCDDEYTEVGKQNRRLIYQHRVLFRHCHPAVVSGRLYDSTYARCDEHQERDRATLERRRKQGFGGRQAILSVVIITTPERDAIRARLVAQWEAQRNKREEEYLYPIELVFVKDCGELSRGVKRDMGVRAAGGTFVMHADDDDPLADGFLERWAAAAIADCRGSDEPDCFELHGVMEQPGAEPVPFHHSIRYPAWSNERVPLERTPNHCNIIRADLARQVYFADKHYGEDHCWSSRIRGLLRREAEFPGVSLVYHPSQSKEQA